MFSLFFISALVFMEASLAEVYAIVKTPAEKTPTRILDITTTYSDDNDVIVSALHARPADIATPQTNSSFFMFLTLSYNFPNIGADTRPHTKFKQRLMKSSKTGLYHLLSCICFQLPFVFPNEVTL